MQLVLTAFVDLIDCPLLKERGTGKKKVEGKASVLGGNIEVRGKPYKWDTKDK